MILRFLRARKFIAGAVLLMAIGMASMAATLVQSPPDAGVKSFSADRILADIRTLSSDEFEGRGPGTKGEELSIAYMEKQFRAAGLEPGNPNGSYLQEVPLVGIRPDPGTH